MIALLNALEPYFDSPSPAPGRMHVKEIARGKIKEGVAYAAADLECTRKVLNELSRPWYVATSLQADAQVQHIPGAHYDRYRQT